jgi:PEP-CTERM motif
MSTARWLALVALLGASAACRRADSPRPSKSGADRITTVSPQRPVYPYSVVRGGVESGKELAEALLRDSAVAEHYRDLDPQTLHPVKLDRDQFAYVSYRHRNKIYWTAKKLRLAAGERVLAVNSTPIVRARCGNRISFQPVGPHLAADAEPTPEVLNYPDINSKPDSEWVYNTPVISFQPPQPAIDMPSPIAENTHSVPDHFPPLYPVIVAPAHSPGGGTAHTPEPGTFFVVGAGLAVLLWRNLRPRA